MSADLGSSRSSTVTFLINKSAGRKTKQLGNSNNKRRTLSWVLIIQEETSQGIFAPKSSAVVQNNMFYDNLQFFSQSETRMFKTTAHIMNYMKLVIPKHSLYWSIHTKDESKRGTVFAFIFGVN